VVDPEYGRQNKVVLITDVRKLPQKVATNSHPEDWNHRQAIEYENTNETAHPPITRRPKKLYLITHMQAMQSCKERHEICMFRPMDIIAQR